MVDKCSTVKRENNGSKQGSFALPKIGGEFFKIVKSIKANVDNFCEIKDEAKKIPSPHCSLIINAFEKEKESKKKKEKNKPSRFTRLKGKKSQKGTDKDDNKSSSAEMDESLCTTLYLFKKTLLSDSNDNNNNNNKTNNNEMVFSQKPGTAESSRARSKSPKSNSNERKTTPVRQRTPSPQTPRSPNRNTTTIKNLPNNKNKSKKNEAQATQPKNKTQLLPLIKIGVKKPKKNKGQNEKLNLNQRPRSPPQLTPITGIEVKKRDSNKNVPSENPSKNVSMYSSICECSKSDESLLSCKSQWLNEETKTHHNYMKEIVGISTSSKIIMTEMREKIDKGIEATTSHITALEEEIRLINFSNIKDDKIKDKINKNKNAKKSNDKYETSKVKTQKDKQETDILKKKSIPKKGNEEKPEIIEKPKEVSKVDEVKSPCKTQKDKQETEILKKKSIPKKGNEEKPEIIEKPKEVPKVGEVKSPCESAKSLKQPEKSANDVTKPTNEQLKPSNGPTKSASESTASGPKPSNGPPKCAINSNKKCDQNNNKTKKTPTQIPNEKQKTTNPQKLVPVLKWDKRTQGKGLESIKSKNELQTKRTKSVYHNMCTISKPPLNENDPLAKPQTPMPEELRKIKAEVDQAIAQKKVFTVCGNYYSIRRALTTRGWIEKMKISFRSSELVRKLNTASMVELLDLLKDKEQKWLAKRIIMSRMLANCPVDLFWDYSNDIFKNSGLHSNKFPLINRLRTGFGYSSKSGLCDTVKRSHWYQIPGVSCLSHPRTYNFAHSGDPHDFLEDYKRTAAMSVLKWIVERSTDKVIKLISNNGKIPLSMFEFALIECKRYLKMCKHKDIDMRFSEASDLDWHEFFEHFYALIHLGEHFKSNDVESVESLVLKSKIILSKIRNYFPCLEMDNTMNVWILKPCNGCRGIGIHLCRTLEYILTIIKNNPQRKYVIQKYIERPLLIHNTKFDIRQWFLISNTNPLTLWIYKECYVRLSSQTFNIRKLHESIHLTNNSIQARYRNTNRDPSLPNCNMWTLTQFKKYLALIGHPKVFEEIIFPGMKQNITCAILANEHRIFRRKNTFEIYGSDFMITEDFKPWLLEINCRPALYGSTPVTAKLCPRVLEDTIKLMVDHERDKKPNTTNFELLYKEKIEKLPKVDPESFNFHIRPITEDFFVKPEHLHLTLTQEETRDDSDETNLTILSLKSEMKMTLERLLDLIKIEKEKRSGLSFDSMIGKISKEVQSETDTLEGALKDVTVIMNLDHVKLPYSTSNTVTGGMHLIRNKTFDEEIEEDDDDDEENDLVETRSSSTTKEVAKSMISGFLHQLQELE